MDGNLPAGDYRVVRAEGGTLVLTRWRWYHSVMDWLRRLAAGLHRPAHSACAGPPADMEQRED